MKTRCVRAFGAVDSAEMAVVVVVVVVGRIILDFKPDSCTRMESW
jgi:hypothetical protein